VAEVRPDDIFVVGVGIEPSAGMKKGVVNDMAQLTAAISASVHKAEKSSGFDIARAFVSVAGSHIASLNSRGVVGISGQRGVNLEDLDKAMEAARAIAIPHNREVLHIVPRSYSLDGQERVRSPLGMHGFRLEVEAHIITASSTSVANLEQSVEAAGVSVDRFILNPLASGEAVLTDEEKEMGAVIIDIGGGTTDMAIFIEGTVWHTAVIPVGGDLITNDLTHWMHVPFDVAETVKIHYGHALQRAVDVLETFLVEPFGDGMPVEVQRYAMAEIIELRVAEQDGKALCVYGGKAESKLDTDVDYLMWADTPRWIEMGKGEYGPMRAMFFQRLRFDGPMGEAMGNMGPFESFLLLVGKVPGDVTACPAK
jgi:cell division protein FtsA